MPPMPDWAQPRTDITHPSRDLSFVQNPQLVAAANASNTAYDIVFYGDSLVSLIRQKLCVRCFLCGTDALQVCMRPRHPPLPACRAAAGCGGGAFTADALAIPWPCCRDNKLMWERFFGPLPMPQTNFAYTPTNGSYRAALLGVGGALALRGLALRGLPCRRMHCRCSTAGMQAQQPRSARGRQTPAEPAS